MDWNIICEYPKVWIDWLGGQDTYQHSDDGGVSLFWPPEIVYSSSFDSLFSCRLLLSQLRDLWVHVWLTWLYIGSNRSKPNGRRGHPDDRIHPDGTTTRDITIITGFEPFPFAKLPLPIVFNNLYFPMCGWSSLWDRRLES